MAPLSNAQKTTQSLRAKGGALRGQSAICGWCDLAFTSTHNRGQLYCSRSCSKSAMWKSSTPQEKAARIKKVATALKGRPSWNLGIPCRPETKMLLSGIHLLSKHRPKVRGGNGKVAPSEALAAEMLPKTWVPQFAISTNKPRGSGYPTHYKADFANPRLRKVLEIDGNSHTSRKSLDAKKDALLCSLGWSVLRVSNKQVLEAYLIFKSTGRMTILSRAR